MDVFFVVVAVFVQAHSQLTMRVPISCSTKTFVSSAFIIQGEGETQATRTGWEKQLLLITTPGGEI